jgi:phosphoenolpyruvate carboxykinase (GTP)
VHQAFDWEHGVFLGSVVGSEVTAAALDLKAGTIRRDPMAMLPFCGYHMGDYFRHWLNLGQTHDADKLPKIFFVNWFRKDDNGRWLWPGYGENSRVLAWIFDRCDGRGEATETAIGIMPTVDGLSRPEGVTEADMNALLSVDKDGWLREIESIKEHYAKFGDRLPEALQAQLEALTERLDRV